MLLDKYRIIKYNDNPHEHTAETCIWLWNETINLIYTWLISINYVIRSLEEKYPNSPYIGKEISNYKYTITNISGAIDEYDISAHSISNEVDSI